MSAMDESRPASVSAGRIGAIDLARGVALLAMTIFHFNWDLELFGVLAPGTMGSPFALWSAHLIAGSFLGLVGISLVLAHGKAIHWRRFARRWLAIAGAAALITVATRVAFPDAYIFFGILHAIAAGSVLALPFLRAPAWLTALAGLAVILIGAYFHTRALDAPIWWWTGLSQFVPRSNDYVPLFPYLGPVLIGVALGKWAAASGAMARLVRIDLDLRPVHGLRFLGRHSLVYYLLHQPLMLSIIYLFLKVIGHI